MNSISPRTKLLIDRLPNHELAPTMRAAMIAGLSAGEQFADQKNLLAKDNRMSETGRQAALMAALTNTFAKSLARAKAPVTKARKEITARRAALTIKPVDPANLSAALERQEIRAWVRQLDLGVRQSVVLATKDRRILEAVVSAPPELSGFAGDAAFASKIEDRYVELVYPSELASIEEMNAVVGEAEAALHIARNDLQTISNLHAHDFDELLRPVVNQPWLVNNKLQVCEVGADGKASYRAADDLDRANGVEYENFAAYQAAQGLARAA
jgi:hypothetical protein